MSMISVLNPGRSIDIVIVCGSRYWNTGAPIRKSIGVLAARNRNLRVITGGACGADMIADTIARSLGLTVTKELAKWVGRGRLAGRERNEKMLSLNPDLVLAFKDDFDDTLSRGGTEHMCKIARQSNIPVMHYSTRNGWRIIT
jgi:hypothetical protein